MFGLFDVIRPFCTASCCIALLVCTTAAGAAAGVPAAASSAAVASPPGATATSGAADSGEFSIPPELQPLAFDASTALPASAETAPTVPTVVANGEAPFPVPPDLQPAVAFWTDIFSKYSDDESLVQDGDDPARIYQHLDFRAQAQQLSDAALDRLRSDQEQQASATVIEALNKLAAHHGDSAGLSPLAQHLRTLFPDDVTPARLRRAADQVRVQRGLRGRTRRALQVAGRYLPAMERIFAGYDLPLALTRLPLVESSFNTAAYSKAGAAGIWQFIPSSARLYMRLNQIQDPRRDPWTSTDAAARHLRDDYHAMGDWPLAVTAYNFGSVGLHRALEKIHGRTLSDLLQRYDSPRFGFASRNFYAEFLAAVQVSRNAGELFGDLPKSQPIQFRKVRIRDYLTYDTVRALSGADARTFAELNPAFTDPVVEGHLYLPPGTAIRVPPDDQQRFETLYAALDPSLRHHRQRLWAVRYRVRRGDVLGGIAARYHVSVAALMRVNGLRSARLVRAGRVLNIPNRHARPVAHVILVADHPRSRRYFVHRVRRGQTLSGIALRYGASVSAIRRLNGLRDADLVRAGRHLKIPR